MIKIVSNEQMRAMDVKTIDTLGVPGMVLMENAGRQTYEYIIEFIAELKVAGRIDIYCGKGNNGGDGYVIARHFYNNGYPVKIISVGDPENLKGDARNNYLICKNFNIPVDIINSKEQLQNNLSPAIIVDALLGTGIKGKVEGLFKDAIDFINGLGIPVVSVDIPSGINGDQPTVSGSVVSADLTVTMALPKRAHLFYPAKNYVGLLEIADISMPEDVKNSKSVALNHVEFSDLTFPILEDDAHKYTAGKLFVLAGSPGMTGAATLTASAALRTGVGLVNIGIPQSLNAVMEIKITEGLSVPLAETIEGSVAIEALPGIKDRINWADAVVIGPGCGRSDETLETLRASIQYCLETETPTLVDADGLYALSEDTELCARLNSGFLLTPHHGEFLRLMAVTKEKIQTEPWQCLWDYLNDKKYTVNLKGAPSMVGTPDGQIYINSTGNASLAKGGSGDVLAGIIGGLIARGLDPKEAAITGNYIHGEAADLLLSSQADVSILPSDLIDILPELFDINGEW
jgi:NAD(P)H-hydrate epimerase